MKRASAKLADMKDRGGELNMSKVAGTLLHILVARRAFEAAIDGAHARVTETVLARELLRLILSREVSTCRLECITSLPGVAQRRTSNVSTHHSLRIHNLADAHLLDLFRGEQAKLNLLDGPERSRRVCKVEIRHGCGLRFAKWRMCGGEDEDADDEDGDRKGMLWTVGACESRNGQQANSLVFRLRHSANSPASTLSSHNERGTSTPGVRLLINIVYYSTARPE